MSWEKVKLGDVLALNYGKALKATDRITGNTPVYGSGGIVGYHNESYIRSKGIIVGRKGTIGKVYYSNDPFCCIDTAFYIRPDDLKYNLRFLFYLLQTLGLEAMNQDSAIPGLSRQFVYNLQIPLPPLPTQQKIAAILDTAEQLRRTNRELIQKYDTLTRSLFLEMFGGYIIGKSHVLAELISINPRKSELQIADNEEVSFVPMSLVGENGEFNPDMIKRYKEVKTGFTYFKEGDVLFAKITPCMENGKGAIAKNLKNGIGFGSTEYHVLRPNEKLNSIFIYRLLSQRNIRKYAESCMTGSAGQRRVPTDFFTKLQINLPPISLQNQFAERVRAIDQQKQQAQKSLEKSEELFNSLLQRAFNGELIGE